MTYASLFTKLFFFIKKNWTTCVWRLELACLWKVLSKILLFMTWCRKWPFITDKWIYRWNYTNHFLEALNLHYMCSLSFFLIICMCFIASSDVLKKQYRLLFGIHFGVNWCVRLSGYVLCSKWAMLLVMWFSCFYCFELFSLSLIMGVASFGLIRISLFPGVGWDISNKKIWEVNCGAARCLENFIPNSL